MDLKIKDVAELLNVSETTIRRWLADSKIPAYKINHQYRFSRVEIENWVMSQKVRPHDYQVPIKEETSPPSGAKKYSLYRALHHGQILYNVPGESKEDVIHAAMDRVAKELGLDAVVLADLLLDRESMMPTGLGNGVAVPHTRDFLLDEHFDVVVIVYPKEPIDFEAIDGKLVDTMFFLFASEDKKHLNLLAKIAYLVSDPVALSFIKSQPSKDLLLEYVKNWESSAIHPVHC